MAKAKEKAQPIGEQVAAEVVTLIQDPLTLASEARLLAQRIQDTGEQLERQARQVQPTTEGEIKRLSHMFPPVIQQTQLPTTVGGVALELLNFKQLYGEAEHLHNRIKHYLDELSMEPEPSSLLALQEARAKEQPVGSLRLAWLELRDKLLHWQPTMLLLQVAVNRHLQAAKEVIRDMKTAVYSKAKHDLRMQDAALDVRYEADLRHDELADICMRLGVSF